MRISDWSSDVCSSDLLVGADPRALFEQFDAARAHARVLLISQQFQPVRKRAYGREHVMAQARTQKAGKFECGSFGRSEEHTSELQSLMRISYAVFCLKKKHINKNPIINIDTSCTAS